MTDAKVVTPSRKCKWPGCKRLVPKGVDECGYCSIAKYCSPETLRAIAKSKERGHAK